MAEQSKPQFSFGAPASSGVSGGRFGQQNSTPQLQGGLFGSNTNTPATTGPGAFGTNNGSSIFGRGTTATGQSSSRFGGGGGGVAGQAPTTSFSFGSKPAVESGSGGSSLFGQTQSSTGQQSGAAAPFLGFATPSRAESVTNTATGQSVNIFGKGASNLFQNTTSSAPTTAATPTSKSAFSFPLGSTTPADPPPSNQAVASNPFGPNLNNIQQQENKPLFSSFSVDTSSSRPPPSKTTAPSQNAVGSGSGMFANLGNPQNYSSKQPATSIGGSNLFANLGGQTSAAPSGGQTTTASLFAKPTPSTAAEAQKASFSFPSSSSQPATQDAQKAQTNAPGLFSNLGASAKPSESSAPASFAPTTSIFGNIGITNDTGKSTAPAIGAAPSFFSNVSKAQDAPSSSASAANTSSQKAAPTIASTSNLFGKPDQVTSSSAPLQSNNTAAEAQGNANTATGATLGQSMGGPAPSAQSRLKNKSMDEIITRWASDLAKYQKEFQRQAEKVATWDHMLVENSEKIQKLYGGTLEAERATAEVERQITAVENDQDELESWLTRYEEKVDQMISNSGDPLHGPDLERERTYVKRLLAASVWLMTVLGINSPRSFRHDWTRWEKISVA